jgi:hypothetical protein
MLSRRLRCLPLLLLLCAPLACKKAPKPDEATKPSAEKAFAGVSCLELAGAPRRNLVLGPDARLYFAEATHSTEAFRLANLRWDIVSVDREGKNREVHVKDTGGDFRLGGPDRVVFRRPMADPKSTYGGSTSVLMTATLSKGDEAKLSEGTAEPWAYVVDVEHELVYFTAHPDGALANVLYKSPLRGGAPVTIGDAAVSPVRVVSSGKMLIGAGKIGETVNFSQTNVDGSGTKVILPVRPYDEAFVGETMIFFDRTKQGAIMSMPLSGTPDDARKVPGSELEDELVHGRTAEGDATFLQRKEKDGGYTLMTVSSNVEATAFTRVPLPVDSAVPLPAGAVAALFLQDSGGAKDGKQHYGDEADLCIVGASKTMLAIATRQVPLVLERGKAGLDAIAKGLDGATMKALDASTVAFITRGALKGSLDDLRTQLAAVQKSAADATKDPHFGVVLVDDVNHHHAIAFWSESRGAIELRVGGHDVMLPNPADYTITVEPKATLHEDFAAKQPYALTCTGVVKSTGAVEVTLDAECRATPAKFPKPPPTIKTAIIGKIAPAGNAKYTIDLGGFDLPPTDIEMRFLEGGKEVPFLDTIAMDDGADWVATLDRIAAGPGFTLRREGDEPLKAVVDAKMKHGRFPKLEIPEGFAALDAKKQGELATALWKELAAHAKKFHPGDHDDLELYVPGKTINSWVVEKGKLSPYPRP